MREGDEEVEEAGEVGGRRRLGDRVGEEKERR